MKVYISGPMSGLPNYNRESFNDMEDYLRARGYRDIFNPAKLPPGQDWSWYMETCLSEVPKCDRIVLLPGWKNSVGACMEHALAVILNLQVEEFEEF